MKKVVVFALVLLKCRIKQIYKIVRAILFGQITFYPDYVVNFENRFSNYIGVKYGLSFCNGTSAIEAALFAIGIQPGDEVIVPSCTFHASIDPIVNAGAIPVFVDVSVSTLTASPEEIAGKIGPKTKAIILVHLFGTPADVPSVKRILKDKKIHIIEDASHAHGAMIGDRFCGSFGDIAVFSLQGRKAVAAGEGGVAVTNRKDLYLKMSLFGHFDRHASEFEEIGAQAFRFTGYGYKRRIAPLSVLLADSDMDHLDLVNGAMNHTVAMLEDSLSSLKSFKPIISLPGSKRGGFFYGYPVYITTDGLQASTVISALSKSRFEAMNYPFQFHHKLRIYNDLNTRNTAKQEIDRDPFFDHSSVALSVTEGFKDRLFFLPRKYLITLNSRKIQKIKQILSEF